MKRFGSFSLGDLSQVFAFRIAALLVLSSLLAAALILLWPTLGDSWWMALLFGAGLALLPIVAVRPTRWAFIVLVLALPFSARLRFGSLALHPGGAEAALAPIDFPLLVLLVLYLLEDIRNGQLIFYAGRVERRLLLFGALGLLSIVNAVDPGLVLYEVIRVLRMVALIYCVKRFVRSRQEVRLVLYLLAFDLVTQSAMGLAQRLLGRSLGLFILGEADALWLDTTVQGVISRVGGTLGHANSLAMFLEMLLPLFFSLAVARDTALSPRNRWLSVLAFTLGLSTLILTFSRSSWLAVFVALALVLLYHFRHLRFTRRQAVIIFGAAASSLAGLAIFWDSIYRRLTASAEYSFGFRAKLNGVALDMLEAHPWLGTGLNNFSLSMADYNDIGLPAHRFSPAHNIYLLTAAETGLLGLLAFLWLLLGIFTESWPALKSQDRFLAACAAGLLAGLAAALIHSNLGWLWRYDVVHVMFWFTAGYALAIRRVAAERT
jgi:putative inorganic carbon (HCO3(-)) transporter